MVVSTVLVVGLGCSVDPRPAELERMIGEPELAALCGGAVGPAEIDGESFPLRQRKVSLRYDDEACGISVKYRLYTYSSEDGAAGKFDDYEATYDGLSEGFEKQADEAGRSIRYLRPDGTGVVFLSRGGRALISGSARGSAQQVEQLLAIVDRKSARLAGLEW